MHVYAISAALVGLLAVAAATAIQPEPPKPAGPAAPRVSGPFTHANLTVFLLHGPDAVAGQKLLTLQEALEQKKAVVHETSQVNELAVENLADDVSLFIQSGDIIKGGKQDRVLSFDMVLPPKSGRVPIGSFCVESGRWQKRGGEEDGRFSVSENQAPGKDLKLAINDTRQQGQVWDRVKQAQEKLSMNVGKPVQSGASPSSLQLALEDKQLLEKLGAYETALAGVIDGKPDVIGVALAVNGKVEGAELYGSTALFRKLWPKVLKSAATDALAEFDDKKKFEPATATAVESFLADAAAGPAQEVTAASAGEQGQQRQAPNSSAQQAVRPAQPAGPPAVPPRVRIVRYDGSKVLLIECQDKEQPAVIHRSYIAK